MHTEPVPALRRCLDNAISGLEWVHTAETTPPGYLYVEEDVCYPYKKMIQSSLGLLPEIDVLLIPRLVSLDGFLQCPNFRALPDIVRLNMKQLGKDKIPVMTPILEVTRERDLKPVVESLARELGELSGQDYSHFPSGDKGRGGCLRSENTQDRTDMDWSKTIAVLGHPYVTADAKLNNGVVDIIKSYGYHTAYAEDVPFDTLNRLAEIRDYYAKIMYWRSARLILGAFMYYVQNQRPAGIISLVPFNCGVDALTRIELMSIYRQLEKKPPYMVIVCDQHTQRDHVVTRIEAFLDIIEGISLE
jgi:predicted nucleotide-binding protein (sugar kinase/HSP70/actin superfamily)